MYFKRVVDIFCAHFYLEWEGGKENIFYHVRFFEFFIFYFSLTPQPVKAEVTKCIRWKKKGTRHIRYGTHKFSLKNSFHSYFIIWFIYTLSFNNVHFKIFLSLPFFFHFLEGGFYLWVNVWEKAERWKGGGVVRI